MLPQLAKTYSPTRTYPNSQWLASPKLDGLRCMYFPERGLISRSGKTKYVGLEAIEQICLPICQQQNLTFLDGELYIPGEKFDVISGIVRKSRAFDITQKNRVELHVFACGSATGNVPATSMVDLLNQILPASGRVISLEQSIIENTALAVQTKAETVKAEGRSDEGIMLRNPNSIYSETRSDDLVKVKNFVKTTFVITGFTKGRGRHANSLGSVLARALIDGSAVNTKVGSGFNDLERSSIWANQSNYLGLNIEVINLGVTRSGNVRHPIFSQFL